MTLCEAYIGIEPHFDMWNYFFLVRHLKDLNAELTILGHGYPRQVWVWCRSLFQHPHTQNG
jgi:hypothetical protein